MLKPRRCYRGIYRCCCVPATPTWLEQLRKAQLEDKTLQNILNFCEQGWPTKNSLCNDLKPYWSVNDELTIHNNLSLHGNRIVIPFFYNKIFYKSYIKAIKGLSKHNLEPENLYGGQVCQNKLRVSFRIVILVVRAFQHKLNYWFLLSYQSDHGKNWVLICLNTKEQLTF